MRLAARFFGRWSGHKTIRLHGQDVLIPIVEGQGYQHRSTHEPAVDAIFQVALSLRPGTFVDVGANVGQTLIKVKAVEPGRSYIGFEASPFCCYYLSRLIAENAYQDCVLVPYALSDHSGTASFHFSGIADAQATIIGDFWTKKNARENKMTVLLGRGDDVLASMGTSRVGIIKIDVEGGELEVVRGMDRVLRNDRPLVIIEVLPYIIDLSTLDEDSREKMVSRKQRSEQLTDMLRKLGYVCHRLLPDGSLDETWEFGMERYDSRMTNYVLVPSEESSLLADLQEQYRRHLRVN